MDLNSYKTDLDKAEDGIWVDFGEEASILIAQWGNKAHTRFLKNVYKRNKKQIDLGMMDDFQASKLMSGQWPCIILDWKGIEKDGDELKYSPNTVVDLSINPQYKKFFANIEEIAKDDASYLTESVEEVGKTLPTT